ncbi:hypothetical protein FHX82_004403 [Amycolatopsis bartoniae]|uniref:Uncharacterized protein n=1 Tax=Amycolatopsis bartoniae TaxID=941986 RepID=A0A8H9J526_9PSEU|nr:hypothetical protein [Amycolatopsis bartoniae]MBB2937330.1 hypothetical protein [Amycolatopsis bartoniae]TVT07965.1 hypothetical protein FNH07_14585 [Amycolatopsis bartoniae]GHF78219.1 hypothetical protein GCM10017566_60620 [Amycolatopsis bartoniae]
MKLTTLRTASSHRAALAEARLSRRPSRLGSKAGTAPEPDHVLAPDDGFPGLLRRAWQRAIAAPDPAAAVDVLLTLDGHVPADVQLRALRLPEQCALKALFGLSWQDGRQHPDGTADGEPVHVGELGLTTGGRIAVGVPSQRPLGDGEDLVDGVLRVRWTAAALERYREELHREERRALSSVVDCRKWLAGLGTKGRNELLDELKDAALRTAPFVLYQDTKRYTNFREHNTLTGKTLWPGHPDCALSSLQGLALDLWSDNDVVLVVCLKLLVLSVGYGRIEEANGTQLTVAHVAALLDRVRRKYNSVPGAPQVPHAASADVNSLRDLAWRLREQRQEISGRVQLYREIHGPLMHKIEQVAAPRGEQALAREAALAARLSERLPLDGKGLDELSAALSAAPDWLTRPYGDFGTGLEALVAETVSATVDAFETDFAMSRGIRSLPMLLAALREQDWSRIVQWDLPDFFCCVIPDPAAARHFGGSAARLADVAWSMSARMQYNSWHFLAGNLPKTPEVVARDYFVPPVVPDLAYYSDQHHHGHVAAKVRFSIRSPQAVELAGRRFGGFVDLRLLRCAGTPFDEQDLLAADRASRFLAHATTLTGAAVAAGADCAVTAFDSRWHWSRIAGGRPGESA